jgi:K+-sensing histidine kinase KdpD
VSIDGARLIFWDTGPGVRPPLEEVCFDVFVSDKPKNEGHGLGLYIVRQLLEEQGCRIFLDTARNERGRRYKFIVDFTGVMEE